MYKNISKEKSDDFLEFLTLLSTSIFFAWLMWMKNSEIILQIPF